MDMSLSKLWKIGKAGKPGMLQSTGLQRVGHDLATEQQQQHKKMLFPSLLAYRLAMRVTLANGM